MNIKTILLIIFTSLIMSQGFAKMKDTGLLCALDMGSNSFKFIVGELKGGKYIQHVELRNDTKVGDDLKKSKEKTGKLIISDEKIAEIKTVISEYSKECQKRTSDKVIHAIATAAFRQADNGHKIISELKELSVDLKVLSGEEESDYAYESATFGKAQMAVVDMGSRSTEIVSKSKNNKFQFREYDIGYKTSYDDYYKNNKNFAASSKEHLNRIKQLVSDSDLKILKNNKEFIALEAVEIAMYLLNKTKREDVDGVILSHETIKSKIAELNKGDGQIYEKLKSRDDVAKILPRLVFMDYLLTHTGYKSVRISTHELNVAIISKLSK